MAFGTLPEQGLALTAAVHGPRQSLLNSYMAGLSFHETANSCSIQSFTAVSNSLFFFRINVFEIDIRAEQVLNTDRDAAPAAARKLGCPKIQQSQYLSHGHLIF